MQEQYTWRVQRSWYQSQSVELTIAKFALCAVPRHGDRSVETVDANAPRLNCQWPGGMRCREIGIVGPPKPCAPLFGDVRPGTGMIQIVVAWNQHDSVRQVEVHQPQGSSAQFSRVRDMDEIASDTEQVRIACGDGLHQVIQRGAQMPVLSIAQP